MVLFEKSIDLFIKVANNEFITFCISLRYKLGGQKFNTELYYYKGELYSFYL